MNPPRTTLTGYFGKSAPLSAITHFKAEDKCVTAYHADGEIILTQTIDALEAEFGETFIVCCRGTLVAKSRVVAFSHDTATRAWSLYLDGAGPIVMSRRHRKAVLSAIPGLVRRTVNPSRMTKERYAANQSV